MGDRFAFADGRDGGEHEVTQDLGSHLEFDGRPNKRLSKDTMVKRVGEHDPGERTSIVLAALGRAVSELERGGDVSAWAASVSDVVSRAVAHGMGDVVLPLEKLGKQGAAVFARARPRQGEKAIDALAPAVRKRWAAEARAVEALIQTSLMEGVRAVVRGVLLSGRPQRR